MDALKAAFAPPAAQPGAPAAEPTPPTQPQAPAPQAPDGLNDLQQQLVQTRTHASQVQQENAILREELAKGQKAALEKMSTALDRITELQTRKELSPEERKARIDAEFAEINSGQESPKAVIKKWVGEDISSLTKTVQDLKAQLDAQAKTTAKVDRYATRNEHVTRLYNSGRQEVADPGFASVMFSPENVQQVQEGFYKDAPDAATIYSDPSFYNQLYLNAKILAAGKFQPTIQKSQADLAAQATLANVAPSPQGHAPGAAPAPVLTPEQQFKKQLLSGPQSFGQALANTNFRQA